MAKIVIASFGLAAHNTRLMPWRTVVEVAQGLRVRGHDVLIVSVSDRTNPPPLDNGDQVVTLKRQKMDEMRRRLGIVLGSQRIDAVFLPISWSGNTLMRELFDGLGTIRIGYLPGSAFEFPHLVGVIGKLPLRSLLPYLAQSLYPRPLLTRALSKLGLRALIANSDYSARRLASVTNIPVSTIAPGHDPVEALPPVITEPTVIPAPTRYFLFMGPPLPIRGTFILLDAYKKVADQADIPPLLCLFRSDANLDIMALRTRIERRWAHEKIHFVWTSLPQKTLQAHIKMSAAVIMPFLVVPSEIPLAVYEAAGMGKIVITTGPHGTGDFVSTFGEIVRAGDVDALANAMRKVALRNESREDYADVAALAAFNALDDWQTVADRWGSLVDQAKTIGTSANVAGEKTPKIESL